MDKIEYIKMMNQYVDKHIPAVGEVLNDIYGALSKERNRTDANNIILHMVFRILALHVVHTISASRGDALVSEENAANGWKERYQSTYDEICGALAHGLAPILKKYMVSTEIVETNDDGEIKKDSSEEIERKSRIIEATKKAAKELGVEGEIVDIAAKIRDKSEKVVHQVVDIVGNSCADMRCDPGAFWMSFLSIIIPCVFGSIRDTYGDEALERFVEFVGSAIGEYSSKLGMNLSIQILKKDE